MAIFLLVSFVFLMVIGAPLGLVIGLTALFGLFKLGDPGLLGAVSQQFFTAMNNYALVAMPLFYLAGEIMNGTALTTRLVDFSNALFGRFRGSLAQVSIITSILFAGISGSAVADTAALSSIFIPSMTKEGYDKDFSTAVVVASSMIAPIIPPSIIMVIYGAIMGVSIGGLFAAGIIPGLMVGFSLMILTRFFSKKRNYPKSEKKLTIRHLARTTKRAWLALILPFIILGGILGGVVTPTEAGAIVVGYALFLGFFVYRNLKFKDLYGMFLRSSVAMGVVVLILGSAAILGWLLTSEQLPEKVAEGFLSVSKNKYLILLLVNLFLIFVGMFMDIIASLLILAPIFEPLVMSFGVDPLHFGVMMCINLSFGLITPPLGGCLFVSMTISRLNLAQTVKALFPFMLVEFVVLFLVVYIPSISMYLPRLFGFVK
jgi:tripartite ATP-independent transporter DctM subunit